MVKKIFVILILVAILINSSWLIGNNTYAVISNAINMKTDKEEIKVGESIKCTQCQGHFEKKI